MKETHMNTLVMSASSDHRKSAPRRVSVITPFLRHLNMGTLALLMFVALASLPNTRGKEAETKSSIAVKSPKTDVVIGNFNLSPERLTEPIGATVIWINHENASHAVTSLDQHFQKSAVLDAGQRFASTFVTPGTDCGHLR